MVTAVISSPRTGFMSTVKQRIEQLEQEKIACEENLHKEIDAHSDELSPFSTITPSPSEQLMVNGITAIEEQIDQLRDILDGTLVIDPETVDQLAMEIATIEEKIAYFVRQGDDLRRRYDRITALKSRLGV